jgi:hypothetical protein
MQGVKKIVAILQIEIVLFDEMFKRFSLQGTVSNSSHKLVINKVRPNVFWKGIDQRLYNTIPVNGMAKMSISIHIRIAAILFFSSTYPP